MAYSGAGRLRHPGTGRRRCGDLGAHRAPRCSSSVDGGGGDAKPTRTPTPATRGRRLPGTGGAASATGYRYHCSASAASIGAGCRRRSGDPSWRRRFLLSGTAGQVRPAQVHDVTQGGAHGLRRRSWPGRGCAAISLRAGRPLTSWPKVAGQAADGARADIGGLMTHRGTRCPPRQMVRWRSFSIPISIH